MACVTIEYDFSISFIDEFVDCRVTLEVADGLKVKSLVVVKEEHVYLTGCTIHQLGNAVQAQLTFDEVILVAGLNVGQRTKRAVGEATHFLQFLQIVQIIV